MTADPAQVRPLFAALPIDLVTGETKKAVHQLPAANNAGRSFRRQGVHAVAVVTSDLHVLAVEKRFGGDRTLAVRLQGGYGSSLAPMTGDAAEAFHRMAFQERGMGAQRRGEILKRRVVIAEMAGHAPFHRRVAVQLHLSDLGAQVARPFFLRSLLRQANRLAIVRLLVALPLLL